MTASSKRVDKFAPEERACVLRAALAERLTNGMQAQELHSLLGCSRTTAWRFMRGGRVKSTALSRAMLALGAKSALDPDFGPGGIDSAFRAWKASTIPQDQRRAMHRIMGFISELAVVVFGNVNVVTQMMILPNGRPADMRIMFTTASGVRRLIRIGISESFTLSLELTENLQLVCAGLAEAELLGRMLKDHGPRRKR